MTIKQQIEFYTYHNMQAPKFLVDKLEAEKVKSKQTKDDIMELGKNISGWNNSIINRTFIPKKIRWVQKNDKWNLIDGHIQYKQEEFVAATTTSTSNSIRQKILSTYIKEKINNIKTFLSPIHKDNIELLINPIDWLQYECHGYALEGLHKNLFVIKKLNYEFN